MVLIVLCSLFGFVSPNSFVAIPSELSRNCSHTQELVYAPGCPLGNHYQMEEPGSNCRQLEIALAMEFQRLFYIDDTNENFAVSAQLTARWWVECPDFSIKTNEMSFRIDDGQFWAPSLMHLNAIDDLTMTKKRTRFFAMKRQSDKPKTIQFYWQKIGVFKSQCNLVFQSFPFDQQECAIVILLKENTRVGSLKVISSSDTHLNISDGPESIDIVSESSSWRLTGFSFTDAFENIYRDNRSVAIFTLKFKRRPEFYVFNFILPCFILNTLSLTSFAIKVSNPDRLMLAVTLLLALVVAHTDISEHVPPVPQRNLLSNYADFAILHCWITMVYFAAMVFAYKNSQWTKRHYKIIEIIAFIWFTFQVIVVNLYLLGMLTSEKTHVF